MRAAISLSGSFLPRENLCEVFRVTPDGFTRGPRRTPSILARCSLRGPRDPLRSLQDFHLYTNARAAPLQCYAGITQRKCPNPRKGAFQIEKKTNPDRQCPLREDGDPAWWEGFYREDVITEAGKKTRRRRAVNLGTVKDIRSKKAALQKLAVILEPLTRLSAVQRR